MYRTRVGYTGGTTPAPIYRDMGDHTESLQIDFDPQQISLKQVVELFWQNHSPIHSVRSRQYMAAIWFADEEQHVAMDESAFARAEELSAPIQTPVLPGGEFYLAEDYHQKYRLQRSRPLMKLFSQLYPDFSDFVDSTAAARLNGDKLQIAGKLSAKELSQYGVLKDEILRSARSAGSPGWNGNCSV